MKLKNNSFTTASLKKIIRDKFNLEGQDFYRLQDIMEKKLGQEKKQKHGHGSKDATPI